MVVGPYVVGAGGGRRRFREIFDQRRARAKRCQYTVQCVVVPFSSVPSPSQVGPVRRLRRAPEAEGEEEDGSVSYGGPTCFLRAHTTRGEEEPRLPKQ
jgi:hypothetical protein